MFLSCVLLAKLTHFDQLTSAALEITATYSYGFCFYPPP